MTRDTIMIGLGFAGLAVLAAAAALAWAAQAVVRALVPILVPILAGFRAPVRLVPRRLHPLLDPARAELPGIATLGVLLIASLWLLFGVMQDLIAGDPLVHADHAVLHLLLSLRVGWAVRLAVGWSALGSGAVVVALEIGIVLWLDRQRAWRAMAYAITAAIGAILFTAGLDVALDRPAPFLRPTGLSLLPFPGTHLAVLTALLGFMGVVICRTIGAVGRIAVVAAMLVFLTGLLAARLYLGADYLSTALETVAFGAAWAALLGFAYLVHPAEAVRPAGLGVAILLLILGVGGVSGALDQRAALRDATLAHGSLIMSRSIWLHGGWARLPRRSLSLLGDYSRPFPVQFLGAPRVLRRDLTDHGWHPPPPWNAATLLRFFGIGTPPGALPVMPRFDDGRLPALVLIRTGGTLPANRRLVFRLWRSPVLVPSRTGGFARIWLGAVSLERIGHPGSIMALPQEVRSHGEARHCLIRALGAPITVARADGHTPLRLAFVTPSRTDAP
ncbi:LssY C-terminal domain-containing protein [Acidiphilium acidophilum]|uniref:LssY C-terminal domain-containing protein n=1 Tax=Acidiphilium acidophilum TaxID=76588 RepID=A0AAW9DTW2_ACIAO|nr:LssY C-terminal domain-containing protein [Acidiphilium acidophilum]MDX5931788.1 LssY C-terminal domain-containing protein [Acidiphilium acidophilum]